MQDRLYYNVLAGMLNLPVHTSMRWLVSTSCWSVIPRLGWGPGAAGPRDRYWAGIRNLLLHITTFGLGCNII